MAAVLLKDPSAVLDYVQDWDDNYLVAGETISTSSWAVVPTGELTIDSDSNDNTTATVWVSAGTRGGVYRLTNTITTTDSRTEFRTITIRVDDR